LQLLFCASPATIGGGGGNVSACRRVGVSGETKRRVGVSAGRRAGETYRRVGGSAYRHAWRGRVALPRDRRCTSGNFPFADYAATALYPTFTPFCLFKFYNVQRRSRGSATLPCHACRYADPPTRRPAVSFLPHADPPTRPYADTFLPLADPPTRRFVSPHTPTRRYADTPFRFSRLPLAHAGGISTGACRNLRIYAHKTWEKTRILFSSYSNPIFRWRVFSC
jgi:hypothetical protein